MQHTVPARDVYLYTELLSFGEAHIIQMATILFALLSTARNTYMRLLYYVALALNGYKFFFSCKYIYDYYWYDDALYHVYPWQRWFGWLGYATESTVVTSHPLWIMFHLITTFLLMDSLIGGVVQSWHCDPVASVCKKSSACNVARRCLHYAFVALVLMRLFYCGGHPLPQHYEEASALVVYGTPLILLLVFWWLQWIFAYFCVLTFPVLVELYYIVRVFM